jgi:hypothetical protein
VWNDEELTFIQHDQSQWIPSGCTESLTSNSAGGYLYYDSKPAKYGKMDIGFCTRRKNAFKITMEHLPSKRFLWQPDIPVPIPV